MCDYLGAGAPLFRDLTLEVVPGRSVLLMGPNGCGKSSLFRVGCAGEGLSPLCLFVSNALQRMQFRPLNRHE